MDGIERASEYADCFHLSGDEIGDERASALDSFVEIAKKQFNEKYGHEPKVYPVIISDGAHKEK